MKKLKKTKKIIRKRSLVPSVPAPRYQTVGDLKRQLRRIPDDVVVYITLNGPHVHLDHTAYYESAHAGKPCFIVVGADHELPITPDPLEQLLHFIGQTCTEQCEKMVATRKWAQGLK